MWCDALGVRILTCESMDYPQKLLRIPDLPLVLYCTGDTGWLNAPATVGIVGTRKPTEYGLRAAEDIGRGLAKAGAVIVSGLAEGLDSAGHRAALCERSPTIGILGIPIDRTYPTINRPMRKEIESNGCIISEYPPKSEPLGKYGFLQRNRLIAALSAAVVVVEAKEKSGTMYTVDYAKQYRRPVFAVPGSIYSVNSVGTNGLLRTGCAKAVTKAEDLFDLLHLKNTKQIPQAVRPTPAPMSETEKKVLACVSSESKGVEELIAESGLSASILSVTLMKLDGHRMLKSKFFNGAADVAVYAKFFKCLQLLYYVYLFTISSTSSIVRSNGPVCSSFSVHMAAANRPDSSYPLPCERHQR